MAIQQIVIAIVKGIRSNMAATGKIREESEKGYGIDQIQQQNPNMKFQQMAPVQNGSQSPTGQILNIVGGVPMQFQKQMPISKPFIEAEEGLLKNPNTPIIGGYTIQPKTFSSASPYYRTQRLI